MRFVIARIIENKMNADGQTRRANEWQPAKSEKSKTYYPRFHHLICDAGVLISLGPKVKKKKNK